MTEELPMGLVSGPGFGETVGTTPGLESFINPNSPLGQLLSNLTNGNGLASLAKFLIIIGILFLLIWIYNSVVYMEIAKKTGTKNAWFAWIPILQNILMANIAKAPIWSIIVIFAVSFFSSNEQYGLYALIIMMGISTWWLWKIFEARNRPGYWALLSFIPFVGIVLLSIAAWKDNGPQLTSEPSTIPVDPNIPPIAPTAWSTTIAPANSTPVIMNQPTPITPPANSTPVATDQPAPTTPPANTNPVVMNQPTPTTPGQPILPPTTPSV